MHYKVLVLSLCIIGSIRASDPLQHPTEQKEQENMFQWRADSDQNKEEFNQSLPITIDEFRINQKITALEQKLQGIKQAQEKNHTETQGKLNYIVRTVNLLQPRASESSSQHSDS